MFLSTLLSFAADVLMAFLRSKLAQGNFISENRDNPQIIQPILYKRNENGEIWRFLSHFKDGIARSNRYRIELNLPKGCAGQDVFDVNLNSRASKIKGLEQKFNSKGSIDIKAHTVSFPQRALQTFELKHNSAPFKVPYTSAYDPVTFTFYNDENMDTRRYLDIWQASVINFSNNTSNFYSEYVSDIKMYIQNSRGEDVYGVVLFDAFPLGLSMIDLSYSTQNAFMNTSATFSYKYWLPMDSTQARNSSA